MDWETGLIINLTDDGLTKECAQEYVQYVKDFVIEELIEDIPNTYGVEMEGEPLPADLTYIKQQLRDKWL